jgi:dihydroorotate dehydrogenase (fumarate)
MAPDLSTTYLGLGLANPLVPSASPLSRSIDNIRRMEDAGAAAVVLHSLFEEQITFESRVLDRNRTVGAESFWEASSYYPEPQAFTLPPDEYLEHVKRAKEATRIRIIGSLNGVSSGGWIKYARLIEQAGADGLELNVYFVPTDLHLVGAQIEDANVDLVREVRSCVKIRLAVKLSPFQQQYRQPGSAPGRGRRQRARTLQPVQSTGFRPRDARGRHPAAHQSGW